MQQLQKIINLYKPAGPTSHDMVDAVRRVTGEKTVGHAGTLDPFAEGVLLVLVGRKATRRQKEFMQLAKTYVATLRLGATSDTDDRTGTVRQILNPKPEILNKFQIQKSKIQDVLKKFIGDIEQVPPAYSAIKLKGKKAYEIARQGKTPALKPRTVHIETITPLRYEWPTLVIEVQCGSGTYIRALARDIGKILGCGAYVEKLVRTAVGHYTAASATHPEELENTIPMFRGTLE